ncbi:restriction endonuclease [Leisingera caerulea]|uniref:hypothetical protein n=1 Tax=Leisingera caerulea TaxID=506591 RepID=UPI0021A6A2AE|nr:hypothetical protein [Leisingera caerulea]UWQ49335.1 restriction endonuclease [Leisingera caerulea]
MGHDYSKAIAAKGLTIYSDIPVGDPELWIPTPELEELLDKKLTGMGGFDLPNRTRSKLLKTRVCCALGYPAPSTFSKVQPRFPGQMLDVYGQKSNNLQVWNEELAPTRRYVIPGIDDEGKIYRVRVVNGEELAKLDRTGKLTQKYQAGLNGGGTETELVATQDTDNLRELVSASYAPEVDTKPTDAPVKHEIISIETIFERLKSSVGQSFTDPGRGQDRNRGAELHKLVCKLLGYSKYYDNGQFPDIRHQLLEIKLQTSPTIDLGLVLPDCKDPLDVPQVAKSQIRQCDVRYAIFYATSDGEKVKLTHFYLTTGESFFKRFRQFKGNELNKKQQIRLPSDFFDR